MKLRTWTFVTAMSLSSTLAFAQGGASGSSTGSFVVGSSIGGPSDVTTSGALDRGATESLSRSSRDRSNTNLTPSDPRIGQNPRDARGSINQVERSDRNSVINRNRW
jgi:hypothetical protein